MTWEEILQLDDTALNTALESACYGQDWQQTDCHEHQWFCETPQGIIVRDAPPNHTASWDRTMALALRYRIDLQHQLPGETLVMLADEEALTAAWARVRYVAVDAADLRVGICRVALWRAQQAVPHAA